MLYNNLLIKNNKKIFDAFKKLNMINNITDLILFVIDSNKRVLGTLTDGDLRRFIVKNNNMNTKVEEICNKNFSFIKNNVPYCDFTEFKKKEIKILPILNDSHNLVDIIELDKKNSILPLECVIMAGGRGKRLSPLTDNIPKPMLLIGDKPILEYNIDTLISYGIKKIHISVNYLADQIQDYFGDGTSKNIEINYIKEKKFLGTAGSLGLIDKIDTKNFIVINADVFSNVNLDQMYKFHIKNNSLMTIASNDYIIDIPYAILKEKNNRIIKLSEKPTLKYFTNAGIYILNTKLLNKIPKNKFFDITDLINNLLELNHKIFHYQILGYWIDIGKPEDYKNVKELIKQIK